MPEEGADFVGRFRRKNVLELAGLLLDLRFAVHRQAVGEEPLGQPMPSNNAAGPLAAAGREFDDQLPSPIDAATGFSAS